MRHVEIVDEVSRQHEGNRSEQSGQEGEELPRKEIREHSAEQQTRKDEQAERPRSQVERNKDGQRKEWLRLRCCGERGPKCVVGIPKRQTEFVPILVRNQFEPGFDCPRWCARIRRAWNTRDTHGPWKGIV